MSRHRYRQSNAPKLAQVAPFRLTDGDATWSHFHVIEHLTRADGSLVTAGLRQIELAVDTAASAQIYASAGHTILPCSRIGCPHTRPVSHHTGERPGPIPATPIEQTGTQKRAFRVRKLAFRSRNGRVTTRKIDPS